MHAPVRPQFSSDVETQSAEPRRASSERWATRSAWRGRQNAGGSAELESLSDDTLVARLRAQLGDEREACARVLRLMAEVDRRRLRVEPAPVDLSPQTQHPRARLTLVTKLRP